MLWDTEPDLARPCHHLAHIEMDVLARLGEYGVNGPRCAIGHEHEDNGAVLTLWVAKRVQQPAERRLDAVAQGRKSHRAPQITFLAPRRTLDHRGPSQYKGPSWQVAGTSASYRRRTVTRRVMRSERLALRLAALILIIGILGLPID